MPSNKTLEHYLRQLRLIEEHREKWCEENVRRHYRDLMEDLQEFLGVQYAQLAVDDKLTYEILHSKAKYARFLEEVEERIDKFSPQAAQDIRNTVQLTYEKAYEGMVKAVENCNSYEDLKINLTGLRSTTPDVIKNVVQNKFMEQALEKNHKSLIYNIRQQIGIGLSQGDRMSTMAKRLSTQVEGGYKKAMLIARTEVHRAREAGYQDSSERLSQVLKDNNSDYVMIKTWKTMQDMSVRPYRMRGKKGKKTFVKGKGPDHIKMHGKFVLVEDEFELEPGVTAKSPGQSGVAGHDCNCRCRLSRDLITKAKYEELTGKKLTIEKGAQYEAEEKVLLDEKKHLEADKDKLVKEQEALAQTEYTGIWKDTVTPADYEAKKTSIQAKRDYYNGKLDAVSDDEINKFFGNVNGPYIEHTIDFKNNSESTFDRIDDIFNKKFTDKLTPEAQDFLLTYTGNFNDEGQFVGGSQYINNLLRSKKKLPPEMQKGFDDLIAAMNDNPTTFLNGTKVFRATDPGFFGLDRYGNYNAKDLQKFVGKTLTDEGFMSTSLDLDFTDLFDGGITVEIAVPRGVPCAYSNMMDSHELIFKPGTKLKIIDIGERGDGGIAVKAEMIFGDVKDVVSSKTFDDLAIDLDQYFKSTMGVSTRTNFGLSYSDLKKFDNVDDLEKYITTQVTSYRSDLKSSLDKLDDFEAQGKAYAKLSKKLKDIDDRLPLIDDDIKVVRQKLMKAKGIDPDKMQKEIDDLVGEINKLSGKTTNLTIKSKIKDYHGELEEALKNAGISDKAKFYLFEDESVKDIMEFYLSADEQTAFKKELKKLIKNNPDDVKELKKLQALLKDKSDELEKIRKRYGLEDDAFSQARKDKALWFTNANGGVKAADNAYRDKAGEVWRKATKGQKDSAYEYTRSYSKYNEPLRGIEYGTNKFLGVGNVDLDMIGVNGYGSFKKGQVHKLIDDLTDYIDMSSYDQDTWLNRGCRRSGMDKFFGVNLSDFDLSQDELAAKILGTTPTEYGFMSTGVARGSGFSGEIKLNIYAPKGTKMAYVEPFSAFGNGSGKSWDGISKQSSIGYEAEMLMQRNTQFRVIKVEKQGSQWYIDMEVISQRR